VSARKAMWLTACAAMLVSVTAGCQGSSSNKAGGSDRARPPLTLTLLTGDSLFAPEYAAAVERLSGGSMRIEITVAGNQPSYEAKTVEAVRRGIADLGSVGARVWDAFGVTSFRALVAPLLVDSLALEERVLESPLAARMLPDVDRAGVVGVALLPGPLRRPLGLLRTLVAPRDYKGATIAIRFGGVARATFRALGATSKGYVVGTLPAAADGAELDSNTIAENGYDARARALTANVVLWPRPQTIFANRAVFDRLTLSQQNILRRAGREAIGAELARIDKDEAAGLSGICGRGRLSLATASAAELSALRRAVQPVYDALDRDALTRRLIKDIIKLREQAPTASTDAVRCPGPTRRSAATSRLKGLWQSAASLRDLLASGAPPAEAERQWGVGTLELKNGHWAGRERRSGFVWSGSYAVQGNVLRLITDACRPVYLCGHGSIAAYTWSVYRDRLSLVLVSGTPWYYGLIAKPLTRVL
jgi:TRAP-type transport system periplasmic protein